MSPLFRSLALATALAVPVAAPAGTVVTLDEAIQQALTHNAGLRAAGASTLAAQDRARAARGNFLPQLGVRYFARRSDNPLDAFADKLNTRSVTAADLAPAAINEPGTSTLHATQLSIELPLYTGGRNLAGVREAEFTWLREKTGATAGNLSVQLGKLTDAGYITVHKSFRGNYPLTTCSITPKGVSAFEQYVKDIRTYLEP